LRNNTLILQDLIDPSRRGIEESELAKKNSNHEDETQSCVSN